jgi:hypothetical protein
MYILNKIDIKTHIEHLLGLYLQSLGHCPYNKHHSSITMVLQCRGFIPIGRGGSRGGAVGDRYPLGPLKK